MWEQDRYLRAISKELENKKLISFDVFDTALFRTVSDPDKIFLCAGYRMCELYPEYDLPAEVFAGMRAEADSRARKKAWERFKHEDVTLDEIYEEFCLGDQFRLRAKECELESEARHLYLNRYMEAFARHCRERGKILAMVSDTYLSNQQLIRLLKECGFDISLIDVFIISSEFRVLKHNGKLFQRLLNAVPEIAPPQILHIGDNKVADIDGAAIAGIQAEYYGPIPRTALHPMSVESDSLGTVEAIASLRKFASSLIPAEYRTPEETILFETGASIFGAVYSAFAEWVIEQSLRAGISVVLAFMREGELLGQIIRRAALNKGIGISVKLVYISRRTTEIIGIGTIDDGIINEYIHRDRLALSDLFTIFYLDVRKTAFSADATNTIAQYKESGKFDALRSYFTHPSTLAEINEKVNGQRILLIEYIQSLTCGKDAVTVDVGFRGTMQACLTGIQANGKSKLLHLLMMGIPYNNRFLLDGVQIRGWLGYGNENREDVEQIYRRIQMPEAVTNADVGTALAYKKEDGKIIPILETVCIDKKNRRMKKIIWDGIQLYQDCWFDLISVKPHIVKEVINDKHGFFGILSRLLLMPTQEEASVLGGMYYDESILNSEKSTVIKSADYMFYDISESAEAFIDKCLSHKFQEPVYWPEGVVAIKDPAYFLNQYIKTTGTPAYKKAREFLSGANLTGKCVAVYGAGVAGRELSGILSDLGMAILCMVDNNPDLQGRSFSGIKVVSPKDSIGKVDVYIVTPLRFEKEIRELLFQLTYDLMKKPEIIIYR